MIILCLGLFLACGADPARSVAANLPALIGSPEKDWPQWRGPRRDGRSDETGLLASWPEGGPALAWKAADIGRGYSCPIVVGETIYITGDVGEDVVIAALDLDGKVRWRVKNGARWKQPWPGARSAVTYDAGRLYHMNAHGRIACLDAKTGQEAWSANALERFDGRTPTWGLSESLLVLERKVFVTVAGAKALMAALDKETAATIWASPPLPEEGTSYTSPILVALGDRRVLINTGSLSSFAVDAESGKILWSHRHPVPDNVLGATPVIERDSVFITASSRDHNALYRLRLAPDGAAVERVWSHVVKNGQGGLVLASGRLYGTDGIAPRDALIAVDPDRGEIARPGGDLAFGCSTYADGRIYYLSQEGEAALLEPIAGGAKIAGRFRLVEAKENDAWAHPVIAKGRLYLRYHDALYAYDVRKP